jgi:hypothetical protein
MANGPFKMKGMSFKNDQAPIKKINWWGMGTFFDLIRGRGRKEYSGAGSRWNYGQRYDAAPRGWDSSGSANPRVVRSSTGRTGTSNGSTGRTGTVNKGGSGNSGGKKVIVKKT